MYMEKQDIDQLVIAFLNHSISEEDAECLFMWVNEKEENKQYLLSYKKVNLATTFRKQSKYSSNQAYLQFLKRQKNMQTQVFVHRLRSFMKYAAVLFICAFIGFYFYNYLGTNVHKAEEFIVCVPNSKHSFFYLSDSTEVWLNSGTLLLYPSDFIGDKREIYLVGEGYFKVRKRPEQPFIVRTKAMRVQVLGTEFNLSAYPDQEKITTTLEEGSLKILPDDPSVAPCILRPNEQLVYIPSRGKMDVRQVVASDYSDWKEGGLLFNNDSFEEILKTLERVYNVKVHLRTSAYHSNRLTIHFNKHESLENIMMLVKEMIPGLEYQIKEDGIYID